MIPFHKVLIGTAIAFAFAFAVWSFVWFRETQAAWALALSLVFVVAAFALSYYLAHLKRFLGR